MRRTFQDFTRAAHLHDIVTRSVSGHATPAMQAHYSTVSEDDLRRGLARAAALAGFRDALRGAPRSSGPGYQVVGDTP